jgi:hypothetical protein
MNTVVFSGPTLRPGLRGTVDDPEIKWLPPAKRGDIYLAASSPDVSVIGLIDGFFGNVPSVLHKEILWALERGCAVFGAASMGALRAAELHPFGMVGIGAIFRDFANGRLCRDDEVAIEHGPAELGYPPISEALVNIRYTLVNAAAHGRITEDVRGELTEIAIRTFYPRRSLGDCFDAFNARHPDNRVSAAARDWVMQNRVDQKMLDALELVAAVRALKHSDAKPARVPFTFHETEFFTDFRASVDNPIVRDFA